MQGLLAITSSYYEYTSTTPALRKRVFWAIIRGMPHKHPRLTGARIIRTVLVTAACMAASFLIGIQTAGEFHTVDLTEAGPAVLRGDFNFDGTLDAQDVRFALEVAQGIRQPTQDELLMDPNGDLVINTDDALLILNQIK